MSIVNKLSISVQAAEAKGLRNYSDMHVNGSQFRDVISKVKEMVNEESPFFKLFFVVSSFGGKEHVPVDSLGLPRSFALQDLDWDVVEENPSKLTVDIGVDGSLLSRKAYRVLAEQGSLRNFTTK